MSTYDTLRDSLNGRYEIEREIGAGGMATVYLARDLRHARSVALKVLRPELGAVLGVERFLAEIRVTANLQHPHLLPLFDSGEADGLLYYVMPYVPGESLRARLDRERQLSIEEAVRVATAVASALDYAHRHSVIHRDLKPENILMQDGQPVVSDFGIALAVSNAGGARVTQTGLSLGTPAYMSPEQASGDRAIDPRSDVYALAAVTYEMLAGEPPHTGANVQQIISRVLTEEPRALAAQRPTVPEHIEEAVHRGLAKLPADRFSTAREFADALAKGPVHAVSAAQRRQTTALRAPRTRWKAALPWAAAVAGLGAALWSTTRQQLAARDDVPVRFSILPPGENRSFTDVVVSGNGSVMLLSAGNQASTRVWLRRSDESALTEVPYLSSEGGQGPTMIRSLFLSPDGTRVGFVSEGQLRTMPIGGGTPDNLVRVGDGPSVEGASWGNRDSILFSWQTQPGIWILGANGGDPRQVTKPDTAAGEDDDRPSFLPNGEQFLFERRRRGTTTIMLGSTRGGQATVLVEGSNPRYTDGALLFLGAEGAVQSVPFDPGSARLDGTPVTLLTLPTTLRGPRRNAFDLSWNGLLAFVEAEPRRTHVMRVVNGAPTRPFTATPRLYQAPAISPDGRRVAVEVADLQGNSDIWIFGDSGAVSQRLTNGGRNMSPIWNPTGNAVMWSTMTSDGRTRVLMQDLVAGDAPRVVREARGMLRAQSFSPNGDSVRFLSLVQRGRPRHFEAALGDTGSRDFLTQDGERFATVSPDGRWMVYLANEDARSEVFVRPAMSPGPATRISETGGDAPRWAPDGRSIYYRDSLIRQATLSFDPGLRVVARRVLGVDRWERGGMPAPDVAQDGVMALLTADDPGSHVDVLANVTALIRRRQQRNEP